MTNLYEKFCKSTKEKNLSVERKHFTNEEDILTFLAERVLQYKVEGWLCYTSSLWVLKKGKTAEQARFVSGDEKNRGTLLSFELHHKEGDIDHSLHLRQNGVGWELYSYTLQKNADAGTPVKYQLQSYFAAASQDKKDGFPKWKLKYANCWHAVLEGEGDEAISVYQPLVGIFLGFTKGE